MVVEPYAGREERRQYLRLLPKPLYETAERLDFLRQMVRHSGTAQNALGWSQSAGIETAVNADDVCNVIGRTADGHIIYSNTYRLFAVAQDVFEQWIQPLKKPIGERTVVTRTKKGSSAKSVMVFSPILLEYVRYCGWKS